MFANIYQGKTVLITGHTGFKGSWLCAWALKLGAKVVGVSNEIPTKPSMFEELNLANKINHNIVDVRDKVQFGQVIQASKPDFIFHLAAQAIVSKSYAAPVDTLSTNILGVANLLDIVKDYDKPCSVVIITSDKCYENVAWEYGYRENDTLGGRDIYSASKACAEITASAFYSSFIVNNPKIKLATTRAGNVIGGGDWAQDRIVADCVRAWSENNAVTIRCPQATRPWQHVLEPLSGYLLLGQKLYEGKFSDFNSFNFGPPAENNYTVLSLLEELSKYMWDKANGESYVVTDEILFNEASLLKLSCDKALHILKWQPTLAYKATVDYVGNWYQKFYGKSTDMLEFTNMQIDNYYSAAKSRELVWI